MTAIRRVAAWLLRCWRRAPLPAPPVAKARTARQAGSAPKKKTLDAVMSELEVAVDRLQCVMRPAKGLRVGDGEYEALLGRIGPFFVAAKGREGFDNFSSSRDAFPAIDPPSMGAVWVGWEDTLPRDDKFLRPQCFAFSAQGRFTRSVEVTRAGEIPYTLAVLYQDEKARFWEEIPCAYSLLTGEARELRMLRPAQKGGRVWRYSAHYDPSHHAGMTLMQAMNGWKQLDMGWAVICKKGRRCITWRVPESETPAWFGPRQKVQTASGRTRPIIHQVVAHKRELKTKTTYVRPHVRGVSEFRWGRMDVRVVIPQRDVPLTSLMKAHSTESNAVNVPNVKSARLFQGLRDRTISMNEVKAILDDARVAHGTNA